MAAFDDALASAISALNKAGVSDPDHSLLSAVAKAAGPSLYSDDAKNVACSDEEEKKRVAAGFATKIGCEDPGGAVEAVCEQMKAAGAHKHRAAFYYLLVKHAGAEASFR
ncbi:MAG: DUF2853 family protein [Bacteroidota bacterium]